MNSRAKSRAAPGYRKRPRTRSARGSDKDAIVAMAQTKPATKAMSATEGAYAELKRRILAGELAEGSPIRQDEVAAQLGVSKVPLREALMRLRSEGLVKSTPNIGAVVATLTVMDYIEMLDMRLALECRALELAVPNMASVDIAQARELLSAYHAAMTDEEWSDLNVQFHDTLYGPANRPRLLATIRSVQEQMGHLLRLRITMAAEHERSHEDHVKILDACERRETKNAVRLLRRHIEHTQREVQGYFRNNERRGNAS
jgi:DNA-binding GntR family transcriptional regulator